MKNIVDVSFSIIWYVYPNAAVGLDVFNQYMPQLHPWGFVVLESPMPVETPQSAHVIVDVDEVE